MMNSIMLRRKRCLQISLLICLIPTVLVILIECRYFPSLYYRIHNRENISCYEIKSPSLPDVMEDEPPKGKSIFFHETSCHSHSKGRISITSREACAVESAARMNPDMQVYVLYTSPGEMRFVGDESDKFLRALGEYDNIKLKRVFFKNYAKGSPVEDLYRKDKIKHSDYPQSHASDVLRYLTLWKYGGIYLDLDVIVVKSLQDHPQNFAGSESVEHVAAGVLSFAPTGLGQELASTCLNDLRDHFNGQDWGYNGPGVITRLLRKLCGVHDAQDMINQGCQGFKVFPTSQFYAVPWPKWKMYFEENATETVFNMSKASSIIHVWNKKSSTIKIPLGSSVAYLRYAQKYCPKVVQSCETFF